MFKDIIKPTLVLIVISVVISALLAVTYNATGVGELAASGLSAEELAEFQPQALPTASSLQAVQTSLEAEDILGVYRDEGGSGAAFYVVTRGYDGEMKLLVGIDPSGAVAGVAAVDVSHETPGLGSRVGEKEFLDKFIGLSGSVTVDKTGDVDVDAIVNSTVSSQAVGNGVNRALEAYESVKGELFGE